ncbi:MAG: transposase [Thermoleophilia bacterium]
MPRQPRIDAPNLLYHVIARGIERRSIFNDKKDKEEFLARFGKLLSDTQTPLYAFALIPNHFHLLLRRTAVPVSTLMQRLLTSYAMYFNRRHQRCGHLFQNRYKAIVCQDDAYFLELVRYINLNPLRARLVENMDGLGKYRYAGHSYILGKVKAEWLDPQSVLAFFSSSQRSALHAYSRFVCEGLESGRQQDLDGGGLKRALDFPERYHREKVAYDDRTLGVGSFVEGLTYTHKAESAGNELGIDAIIADICKDFSVDRERLLGKSKVRQIARARWQLAYRMERELGMTRSQIAEKLAVGIAAVAKMIDKIENCPGN